MTGLARTGESADRLACFEGVGTVLKVRCPACCGWFLLDDPTCSCGKCWRASWGGISFRPSVDQFYEGKYMNYFGWTKQQARSLVGRVITPFLNFGYWSEILRQAPDGARILDLGCAGGSALLADLGTTVGVDISAASLVKALRIYPYVINADILQLDFPSCQFDLIVSSFLWEHIPLSAKDTLLKKMASWLKPGGRILFLFDVESSNPLFRWLKSEPDLYRKSLIERDGHVGLESLGAASARFRLANLRLEKIHGFGRTLPHLPLLLWLEPYGRKYPLVRAAVVAARLLARLGKLPVAYQFAVHAWDVTLGRLVPLAWSRVVLVVARRV